MSQYQRLLLIAAPALHQHMALHRATALAQASGAALHIVALVEPLSQFDRRFHELPREAYVDEQCHWLRDEAALLRGKGLKVSFEALCSKEPLEDILWHARELQPDLLIKDVQHVPALKRAFITPLDWQLLRECPVPLHLLNGSGPALPQRVVAAVDPSNPQTLHSDLNQQIILAANALALQCDAELHLLHTYDLSRAYLWNGVAGGAAWAGDFVESLRTSMLEAFTALAEHYGVAEERRHFIMGTPTRTIAEFAVHSQTDVLVMGTVHRHGLNKLIGSTTEAILYQAPCGILAIQPSTGG